MIATNSQGIRRQAGTVLLLVGAAAFLVGIVMTLPENHLASGYDSCYDILYPTVVEAPKLVVGSSASVSFALFPYGTACTWTSADGTKITKHFGSWQTTTCLYGGVAIAVTGLAFLVSLQRPNRRSEVVRLA